MSTFPLKRGSKGREVELLQTFLNVYTKLILKPASLKVDGDFGSATENALYELSLKREVSEEDWKIMGKVAADIKANIGATIKFNAQYGTTPYKQLYEILYQDIRTYQRVRKFYDAMMALKANGGDVSKYKSDIEYARYILARVLDRNKKLAAQNGKSIEAIRVADVNKLPQVGVIPFLVAALIGAVVAAGTIYGLYQWLKPAYDESTVDFKASPQFLQIISKLSPEEQEIILKEAEKQVDDAYNQGKTDQSIGDFFGYLKWPIILVSGFLGINWLLDKGNNYRKSRNS